MIDKEKYYVFYDGDCGFCNHWVQWILKNDHRDLFLFAALQSDFGLNFLKERNLNSENLDTIYLWKPEKFYLTKSIAITKIAKLLGGKYRIMSYLNIFPTSIGNSFYDIIAKNRKKIGNQKCFIPNEKEKKKFIV